MGFMYFCTYYIYRYGQQTEKEALVEEHQVQVSVDNCQ